VVLPVSEVSVVPVASKNTKSGDMPAPRTAFTFNDSGPLVPEHEEPVGVGAATGGAAGAEGAEGAEGATDCAVVVPDRAPVAVDPELTALVLDGETSSAQPGNRHADSTKVEVSINGKYTLGIRVRARSSALVIESLFIKISA
jgi:hypothetical protein